MKFEDLGLAEPILRAVHTEGYQAATPIQAEAIPAVIAGHDLIGCAQTGTGKTAAFALPILHRLQARTGRPAPGARRDGGKRTIRGLVLSPTRELACQIAASFIAYGRHTPLRYAVVYGGVSQHSQVRALRHGVDILIATPGRLLDLIEQGYIDLGGVEMLTFDEADQMLDMGFIHDLRRIVRHVPRSRQTLMFSATMPELIRRLAREWLDNPAEVQAGPAATPVETVEQSVYFVEKKQQPRLLADFLKNAAGCRTLVFSRTKHGADSIVRRLLRGGIRAAAIHGNKSQAARQRVLEEFKSDSLPVLVATDVAARGLDIDAVSHVVNYDMPSVPEIYVHRIGRTGRAGAAGVAVSFCGRDERPALRLIERLIRRTIAVEGEIPAVAGEPWAETGQPARCPAKRRKQPRGTSPNRAGRSALPRLPQGKPEGAGKPGKAKRRYRSAL